MCPKTNSYFRSGRERGLFERGVSRSLALPVKISYLMLPMLNPDSGDMEMVQWPYLAPYDFLNLGSNKTKFSQIVYQQCLHFGSVHVVV